jgi:hypothetical protein
MNFETTGAHRCPIEVEPNSQRMGIRGAQRDSDTLQRYRLEAFNNGFQFFPRRSPPTPKFAEFMVPTIIA